MVRGLLVGLLLGLVACSGGVDAPKAHIPIVISSEWPASDQESILVAVETWQDVLGAGIHLDVSIGDCIRGSMPGCIVPVEASDPALQSANEWATSNEGMPGTDHVVGLTEANDILIQKDFPQRGATVLHELGHRLGLEHSDGIMSPEITGDLTITPTILAELASLGLR